MQSKWANLKVWRRAPQIFSIAKAGDSVVIRGTNGTPGTSCYVLTSSDLGKPLTNWTRLATNIFDGRGSLSFTDLPAQTTAHQLYRLQLP